MPTTHHFVLHQNGPALWPQHKSLQEVLDLKASTPEDAWEATYQGNPTPPGGSVFKRGWWSTLATRYDPSDPAHVNACVGRWISWDTANKDEEGNAYTVGLVGELWPDYRLAIRHVYRARLEFPDLPDAITSLARMFNTDQKLRGVLIEDKASGTSAYQSLVQTSETWLADMLVPFQPHGDKVTRAQQVALWCRNDAERSGSVLLPVPSPAAPWLLDFEDELFTFPGSAFADQVDALSQLLLYTEHLLSEGFRLREGIT